MTGLFALMVPPPNVGTLTMIDKISKSDAEYIKTKAGPYFYDYYTQMTNIMKENGPEITEQMDCVMGY